MTVNNAGIMASPYELTTVRDLMLRRYRSNTTSGWIRISIPVKSSGSFRFHHSAYPVVGKDFKSNALSTAPLGKLTRLILQELNTSVRIVQVSANGETRDGYNLKSNPNNLKDTPSSRKILSSTASNPSTVI